MGLRGHHGHSVVMSYIRTLLRHSGFKPWISLALMVFLGLSQGVGLVMLVPLLRLIGLEGAEDPGGIAAYAAQAFAWIGLPLNLTTVLCLYLGIVTVHAMVTRYSDVLNVSIIYGFTQTLRDRLYLGLCRVGWLGFLQMKSSDVTHVLTNDLQRVGMATQQLLLLIGTVIIAVVHIVIALMISVPMTLFASACGCVFLLLLWPLNRHVIGAGEALRGAMGNMYAAVTEHLGGMKIAKSFNLETTQEQNFRNITEGVTRNMVRFTKINSATRMYYQIGAAVVLAAFFFVAVEMVKMPAGSLLLMIFLFARLVPRFNMIQQNLAAHCQCGSFPAGGF